MNRTLRSKLAPFASALLALPVTLFAGEQAALAQYTPQQQQQQQQQLDNQQQQNDRNLASRQSQNDRNLANKQSQTIAEP